MIKIRQEKVDKIADYIPEQKIDNGDEKGKVLILGWGSTYGAIISAVVELRSQGHAVAFSEWNSSPLVKQTTRRGKKKEMFTPTTFSLIHATDFADRMERYIRASLLYGCCQHDLKSRNAILFETRSSRFIRAASTALRTWGRRAWH